jgi:hypothetical protein
MFVLAKGFTQVSSHAALIGDDDTRRLFVELYADPDRPEVRPQEAYQAILSSFWPVGSAAPAIVLARPGTTTGVSGTGTTMEGTRE